MFSLMERPVSFSTSYNYVHDSGVCILISFLFLLRNLRYLGNMAVGTSEELICIL